MNIQLKYVSQYMNLADLIYSIIFVNESKLKRHGTEFQSELKEYQGMKKVNLIAAIAFASNLNETDASLTLNAITDSITSSLKNGEPVVLLGFGTFKVSRRIARTGRNPKTGALIQINSRNVPIFTAGKALKNALK